MAEASHKSGIVEASDYQEEGSHRETFRAGFFTRGRKWGGGDGEGRRGGGRSAKVSNEGRKETREGGRGEGAGEGAHVAFRLLCLSL